MGRRCFLRCTLFALRAHCGRDARGPSITLRLHASIQEPFTIYRSIYDSRFTAFNPATPATTPANSTNASNTADT
jgi:hypothetical protein